jgi:signal transduction histidine kinase
METARDGRRIEVDVSSKLATVMDFELMQLALRQLLDNAVKYSPRDSSIQIRAARSENGVRISVHNSGDPIPVNEQHRVFDRFYRSPALRNTVAGTGMGLSVAREILRAHDGDISVESTSEHGTEFTMVLPLKERSFAGERENSDRRR